MNEKKMNILIILAMILCQIAYWIALSLVAIYEFHGEGISYTTHLTWNLIFERIIFVSLGEILYFEQTYFIYPISWMICFIVFILKIKERSSKLRFLIFVIQPVLVMIGFWGLIAIPFDFFLFISGKLDGEWLAEFFANLGISVFVANLKYLDCFSRC